MNSKTLRTFATAVLLVLFISTVLIADNPGRNILRKVRQNQGKSDKPNYETRAQQVLAEKELMTIIEGPAPEEIPAFEPVTPAPAPKPKPKPKPVAQKTTPKPRSRPKKQLSKPQPKKLTADPIFEMVPANAFFCLRINNFEYTLSQIDQFISGISPMPMAASMGARMGLGQLLGSPALTGLNMAGNFTVFGGNTPDKYYILIPVTDYNQFISGNPNLSEPDENGISTLTTMPDANLLIARAANYALLSTCETSEDLAAMAKALSDGPSDNLATVLDADQIKRAAKESLWIYTNIESASEALGPQITQQLEQAMVMAQGMQLGPNMGTAAGQSAITLETAMNELKSVYLSLTPSSDAIKISITVVSKDDAQMLTGFANSIKTLLGEPSSDQITAASKWINDAENADFAGTFNLTDALKMAMMMQPGAPAMPDIPTKSAIAFACKLQGEKIRLDIVLPKEHLLEIMPLIQPMIQMQMQQQMQQNPQNMPPLGP